MIALVRPTVERRIKGIVQAEGEKDTEHDG